MKEQLLKYIEEYNVDGVKSVLKDMFDSDVKDYSMSFLKYNNNKLIELINENKAYIKVALFSISGAYFDFNPILIDFVKNNRVDLIDYALSAVDHFRSNYYFFFRYGIIYKNPDIVKLIVNKPYYKVNNKHVMQLNNVIKKDIELFKYLVEHPKFKSYFINDLDKLEPAIKIYFVMKFDIKNNKEFENLINIL